MTDPSQARVAGPLESFAVGFAEELARQGYAPGSAGQQVGLLSHVSRWLAAEGVELGELTPEIAERFSAARRAAGYANHRTARALAPILAYLRALGVVPVAPAAVVQGPVEELCVRYRATASSSAAWWRKRRAATSMRFGLSLWAGWGPKGSISTSLPWGRPT